MTIFPDVAPNQLSFDLGRPNISEVSTFAGPVIFRHSQRLNNHELKISYVGLNQEQINNFRQHYIDSNGTSSYFEVAPSLWGGLTVVDPSSTYRYAAQPEEEHKGLYYNLSISLKIIDGIQVLYVLFAGTSATTPVVPFSSFAFAGNAPFILNAGGANPTLTLQGKGSSQ
jgi:hypothetical protein